MRKLASISLMLWPRYSKRCKSFNPNKFISKTFTQIKCCFLQVFFTEFHAVMRLMFFKARHDVSQTQQLVKVLEKSLSLTWHIQICKREFLLATFGLIEVKFCEINKSFLQNFQNVWGKHSLNSMKGFVCLFSKSFPIFYKILLVPT